MAEMVSLSQFRAYWLRAYDFRVFPVTDLAKRTNWRILAAVKGATYTLDPEGRIGNWFYPPRSVDFGGDLTGFPSEEQARKYCAHYGVKLVN